MCSLSSQRNGRQKILMDGTKLENGATLVMAISMVPNWMPSMTSRSFPSWLSGNTSTRMLPPERSSTISLKYSAAREGGSWAACESETLMSTSSFPSGAAQPARKAAAAAVITRADMRFISLFLINLTSFCTIRLSAHHLRQPQVCLRQVRHDQQHHQHG